jgi:hypothetical protein
VQASGSSPSLSLSECYCVRPTCEPVLDVPFELNFFLPHPRNAVVGFFVLSLLCLLFFWLNNFLFTFSHVFLEGTCINLGALHRPFYKQKSQEKENYKEV